SEPKSPVVGSTASNKDPFTKVLYSLVDKIITMPAGGGSNNVNPGKQMPNRSLHNNMKSD
ncbi:MAG: hypothetical protein KAT46_07200, partial [Deltaproteobacteria bacterium]|nr:hypothetical protein [Deltaproteobacteria bacterium]